MRILNHDVEFKARSLWPITYFRIQTRGYAGLKLAIRWWKFSFTVDQSFLEEVRICAECDSGEIEEICAGDEGWSICQSCRAVEGNTYYITQEEYEKRA